MKVFKKHAKTQRRKEKRKVLKRIRVFSQVLLLIIFTHFNLMVSAQSNSGCPIPVLSRLQKHRINRGETIESIARQYNLLPETLIRLNSNLQSGTIPIGKEILIPPFNGIRIQVPKGATWQDLEASYGVRADVLFELNGCQSQPNIVFLPGVNWFSRNDSQLNQYTGLAAYPLATIAEIGLGYGWQINPTNEQKFFHSGIDLLAPINSQVLAAETGIVSFVGQEGNYGNLIVINHSGNRQTRYAHLGTITVSMGQQIQTGQVLGTVGMTGKPDLNVSHLHFEVRYYSALGWVAQDPQLHLQVSR